MRTKTLLLSALLGTVGSISAMSQNVYSLNSVGYITLNLVPGYQMVACQLLVSGGNAISNLLNDANGTYDSPVAMGVFQWAGSGYNEDFANSGASDYNDGWLNNGDQITLNPGTAAWINVSQPISVTFVGTVPQGTNNVVINNGFQQISSPAPIGGDMATDCGLTNFQDGDAIFVWEPNAQGYNSYNVSYGAGQYGFDGYFIGAQGDPILNVGQGCWYETTKGPFTFTQIFSVSQ